MSKWHDVDVSKVEDLSGLTATDMVTNKTGTILTRLNTENGSYWLMDLNMENGIIVVNKDYLDNVGYF